MNNIWKYILIIIFGLSLGYIVANNLPMDRRLASNLEINNDSFDLGTINENDTISISTFIKNIGSRDVKIQNIATSCGCTNGVVDKDIVEPNDSTMLVATFSPLRKGYFNSMVNVESTALNSKLTIYIYGYAE